MIEEFFVFGVLIIVVFIAAILFIIFGQVTVRRLRKNEETKDNLGVEFASGWDIINVAQALSIPRTWAKKLNKSPLSGLHADPDVLYKHTNKIDRLLARLFYYSLMFSGGGGVLLFFLDILGIYDLMFK